MADRQDRRTRTAFEQVVARLKAKLGDAGLTTGEFRDNFRVFVEAGRLEPALAALKADGFDMLAELGAADYLRYPDAKDRYGVWYILRQHDDRPSGSSSRRSSTTPSRACRRSTTCGRAATGWSARSTTCTASSSTATPTCGGS